jgi:hypothetical protein
MTSLIFRIRRLFGGSEIPALPCRWVLDPAFGGILKLTYELAPLTHVNLELSYLSENFNT